LNAQIIFIKKEVSLLIRLKYYPRIKLFLSKTIALCLPVFIFVIKKTPKVFFPIFAFFLFLLCKIFAQREFRKIYVNIKHIYGKNPFGQSTRSFANKVIYHQIICALETFRASFNLKAINISGLGEFKKIFDSLAESESAVLMTSHMGSWDLCGYSVASVCSKPLYVVAKQSEFSIITQELEKVRKRLKQIVLWQNDFSILKKMFKILIAGEMIAFVMDQKPKKNLGCVVDFFGYKTTFVSGPAKLACRTQCAIISGFCVREGPWEYRMFGKKLLSGNHGIKDEVVITQMMASETERMIKLYPEQWTWNYNRWKF